MQDKKECLKKADRKKWFLEFVLLDFPKLFHIFQRVRMKQNRWMGKKKRDRDRWREMKMRRLNVLTSVETAVFPLCWWSLPRRDNCSVEAQKHTQISQMLYLHCAKLSLSPNCPNSNLYWCPLTASEPPLNTPAAWSRPIKRQSSVSYSDAVNLKV